MKGSFSALSPKRKTLASPKPYTTIPMPETYFAALGLMGLMHAFQQPSLHEDLRWFYYIPLATPCWPMCGVYRRSEQTSCNGQYAILATFPPAHPERTLVPHHPSLHLGPVIMRFCRMLSYGIVRQLQLQQAQRHRAARKIQAQLRQWKAQRVRAARLLQAWFRRKRQAVLAEACANIVLAPAPAPVTMTFGAGYMSIRRGHRRVCKNTRAPSRHTLVSTCCLFRYQS